MNKAPDPLSQEGSCSGEGAAGEEPGVVVRLKVCRSRMCVSLLSGTRICRNGCMHFFGLMMKTPYRRLTWCAILTEDAMAARLLSFLRSVYSQYVPLF